MRIVVTGGAGFIGCNLVRHLVGLGHEVTTFDKLTYAGNLANLKGLEANLHTFVRGDIANAEQVRDLFGRLQPEVVMHLAAESHVDRSIDEPDAFLRTNVLGTQVLLEAAREFGTGKFVHVSTDEVYGTLGAQGLFTEESPLAPNSPYSASKAASDLFVRSYVETFGLNACITRCSNNYGPFQFPEKLIPLFSTNALEDKPLPIYGAGTNIRDWIFVEDHCRALTAVMEQGGRGEVYNIGADCEKTNLDITRTILRILDKSEDLIRYVEDRPGHDLRYAIDNSKIRRELGWEPRMSFDEGMALTIQWYKDHRAWWDEIKSGAYRKFYARWYGGRLDNA